MLKKPEVVGQKFLFSVLHSKHKITSYSKKCFPKGEVWAFVWSFAMNSYWMQLQDVNNSLNSLSTYMFFMYYKIVKSSGNQY